MPGDGAILILCPLQVEERAVRRALRSAGLADAACVVRTGPGAGGVRQAVERAGRGSRLAILAGVCGGLSPHDDAAPVICRVTDIRGREWVCPGSPGGVTLVGVDEPVVSVAEKRTLHAGTGAQLVDCESHAFAEGCERLGVRWAVVRGISDGHDEHLPAECIRWITPDGRTAIGAVMGDVLRSPRLMPELVRMGRATERALRAVGNRVVRLVREAGHAR